MTNRDRVHTLALRRRRAWVALPAVALIGGGIALMAPSSPAGDIKRASVSKVSPAIVVPDTALTMPAVPTPISDNPYAVPQGEAPGLELPVGTIAGSSALVTLDSQGIPVRALEAYRRAATLVDSADPACHIDWPLLGAIGRVESNHARFAGNQLDSSGVAQPGIIGIALDGSNGTALITDTDGGRLDRDTAYDRAVGPMQFIPSTWRVVGSDADGDGVKNPQDMADAATATAIYLCSGPGDLRRPEDLRRAIMRYNASDSYVRTVIAIADAYRRGVTELPASDLPAAGSGASTSGAASASTKPAKAPAGKAAPAKPAPSPAPTPTRRTPAVRPVAPVVTAPTPASPAPVPAVPVPALPVPVPPVPALPIPGLTPPPGTQQICTISPLGVKICTIVPLASTPTSTP